ncbi:hypothetical protein ACI780_01555 [Geodermatophilus sp. SYSU D00814]
MLFVHGYANSERTATASYRSMLDHLGEMLEIPNAWLGDVFLVYWPGDLPLRGISQASYPYQIGRATRAGEVLADVLIRFAASGGVTREVVFVAHSLGSRVVLAATDRLRRVRQQEVAAGVTDPKVPQVLGIVLMAGAVPEAECEPMQPFARVGGISGYPTEIILHSADDWVLARTFPAGQTFRVDQVARPFFPRAVGLLGGPERRWLDTHKFDMRPFGHSDYWKGRSSADRVSGMFGRPPERSLKERTPPQWIHEPGGRPLVEPNVVDERTLY